MTSYIHIIGDTHNFDSLKNILDKFDNIISLGDIAAVDTKEYFNNISRYSEVWRKFRDKKALEDKDLKWFSRINIEGWKKQFKQIHKSRKNFILCLGNSDLRMLNFFEECKKEKHLFNIIKNPKIENLNEIQVLFLPYQDKVYGIDPLLYQINKNKPLFVLAHCPPLKGYKKEQYIHHYKILKKISKVYSTNFVFIHGHVHPDDSYEYEVEGIRVLAPKANENLNGIGIENHVIQIDTKTGEMRLIDSISMSYINFKKLPEKYVHSDHWNNFDPKI